MRPSSGLLLLALCAAALGCGHIGPGLGPREYGSAGSSGSSGSATPSSPGGNQGWVSPYDEKGCLKGTTGDACRKK